MTSTRSPPFILLLLSRSRLPFFLLLLLTLLPPCFPHPASLIPPPPLLTITNSTTATTTLTTLTSPPLSLTAGRDLECFNLTTPKAHTVELPDCPTAIDFLYHDPTGVMTLQQFSHDRSVAHAFQIPFAWQHGNCQVLLTSGGELAVDTFRLADVVVKALRIMDECPPKSKKGLGGLALVGNGKTMFVVVNGPDLAPDGVGEGEEGEVELGGSGDEGDGVAVVDPDLTSEGWMTS